MFRALTAHQLKDNYEYTIFYIFLQICSIIKQPFTIDTTRRRGG